jgi:hypothetical protein
VTATPQHTGSPVVRLQDTAAWTVVAAQTPGAIVDYSICTLVTAPDEYRRMVDSFVGGGFASPQCEYLFIDNSSGNQVDAYAGINLFLRQARGRHVILCHQDVELLTDGRARLDTLIAELDRTDPSWALGGNAGGVGFGVIALRITDRYCVDGNFNGPFPARCNSLDENFIVVRAAANLALPNGHDGFHLYGTELCLMAEVLGWTAYVVDFHLRHHGKAAKGPEFVVQKQQLIDRYRNFFRSRWITTPTTDLFLSRWAACNRILNHHRAYDLVKRVARASRAWTGRRAQP